MGKECRTWEKVPIEKVNDYFHKKGPSMAWLIEDGKTIMGPTRTLLDCLKVIHILPKYTWNGNKVPFLRLRKFSSGSHTLRIFLFDLSHIMQELQMLLRIFSEITMFIVLIQNVI